MILKKKLKRNPKPLWLVAGLAILALMAFADYMVGPTLSLTVFFLVPIALLAWFVGPWAGALGVLLSAIYWFVEGAFLQPEGRSFPIPIWNGLLEIGLYLVVVHLMGTLRKALDREKQYARTDPQTGALNARAFRELAEQEIRRSQRSERPLTAAYVDLDDFKSVNDRFGHAVGDDVLSEVAGAIRRNIRASDVLARLGGDEFAILLPECGEGPAPAVLGRIRVRLAEAMAARGWPVTFSIGALTYLAAPESYDQMIRETDGLMYEVKGSGKDAMSHRIAIPSSPSS